jgi:conjugative relaxase-like TrwC/TraI family protein
VPGPERGEVVHLGIGKVRRGSKGALYYKKLSHEAAGLDRAGNYYLKNKNSLEDGVGRWFGRGAAEMGLSGPVSEKDFTRLHKGYSPSGEPLSQNVTYKKRRPAFDATFSLTKDCSILASRSDYWRDRIFAEVGSPSVEVGLQYLERHACWSRRGKMGAEQVPGRGFIGASFAHMAARSADGQAVDPQAHIHNVLFNATRGPDGQYRTLDGDELYHHAKTAEALASVEESHRLMLLGFTLERDGKSFKIVGVPDELRQENSKRSRQIREKAGQDRSAAARSKANWETREPKEEVDVPALLKDWGERCDRHGLTEDRIRALIQRGRRREVDVKKELTEATTRALKEITRGESTFSERKFLRVTAIESQCRGVSANDVRLHVWAELEKARRGISQELVYRGVQDGEQLFCTREQYELEKKLLDLVARSRDEKGHVKEKHVEEAIRAKKTLSPDQEKVVRGLCTKPGRVQCLVGGAGTGKTFALDAVRMAHEAAGYRCLGTAVANRAAKGLGKDAGMVAVNTKKLLWDLDHGRLSLDGVCVVLDEAATTDTRELGRIIHEVHKAANSRLLLVGDHRQHQAVGCGGLFLGLVNRTKPEELTRIIRQKDPEDRRMVAAFRDRETTKAVMSLAKRGRVHVGDELSDSQEMLVARWGKDKTRLEERRIIASTNAQVDALNLRCHEELEARGALSGDAVSIKDDFVARIGSRVMLRKTYARLDVSNGDVGTVIATDPRRNSLRVKLDDGDRVVTIPIETYGRNDVHLGFSATSFLSQGASYDSVYLFVHGNMTDAQSTYVMASRHRQSCSLYTTMDDAGENLNKLIRDCSRDRTKRLAHDQGEPSLTQAQGLGHYRERVGNSR